MSNAIEVTKETIKRGVMARYHICSATAEADEIISALAYACTFQRPRKLSGIDMTADKWQELASSVTFNEILEVENCLERFNGEIRPGGRLFYILGALARIYARRAPKIAFFRPTTPQNFTGRTYTKEELQSVVTTVEMLKNIDL